MPQDEVSGIQIHWQDLGQLLLDAVSTGKCAIAIVAPFIKCDAFKKLIESAPLCASITVVTRWRPADVAAGVSDTSIFDEQAADSRIKVFLNDQLHAKLYMVDATRAFLGSANCTSMGLGFGVSGNVELLAELPRCPISLAVFVKKLILGSVAATDAIRDEVEARAAKIAKQNWQPADWVKATENGAVGQAASQTWLPTSRFPDQLFAVYSDQRDVSFAARDAGSTDLAWMDIPSGLDKAHFERTVRGWTLDQQIVRDLSGFLGEGKFFGELLDWFSRRMWLIGVPRPLVEKQLQSLERWLLHFCGDLYTLDSPNYSERLSIRRPPS
jgi:hypothetical protein